MSEIKSPGQADPKQKNKISTFQWVIIAVGVLILFAVLSGNGAEDSTKNSPKKDSTKAVTPDSSVSSSNQADEDVETIPVAEKTINQMMEDAFGKFAGFKKTGKGDDVVKGIPSGSFIVTARHNGSSNFVIEGYDSDNQSAELLVNTIGDYSGTTFAALESADLIKLKITADGAWSVNIQPISKAPRLKNGEKYKGDKVLLWLGNNEDFSIKHKGTSNFVIQQISGNGTELLVNEIGNYSGVVPTTNGPTVFIVSADGEWSMTTK